MTVMEISKIRVYLNVFFFNCTCLINWTTVINLIFQMYLTKEKKYQIKQKMFCQFNTLFTNFYKLKHKRKCKHLMK